MRTLNALYSTQTMRRRYEVWFLRVGLADGSGAWWFRYLLMNLGRNGCREQPQGMPVQIWATLFPRDGQPRTFIQGLPVTDLHMSARLQSPFHLEVGKNAIDENSCRGALQVDGHSISWDLTYQSSFHVTLSAKGWIGFSRTPHSDAVFSGEIKFDGHTFAGYPLGFGLQGHNCGYRHRKFWIWTHAFFNQANQAPSTLEALQYEMPFGLVFRKAVLWHRGVKHVLGGIKGQAARREQGLQWDFAGVARDNIRVQASIRGALSATHVLPYLKTNCIETFDVANNSLAATTVELQTPGQPSETLETSDGAVLEMAGL